MKYLKTFEMFDSEHLRDMHEIETLSGDLDKEDLVRNITRYDSNAINDTILKEIPFFKFGNPQVFLDRVVYIFGDVDNYIKITIFSDIRNTKYDKNSYEIIIDEVKDGIKDDKYIEGDLYTLDKIVDFLKGSIDIIKKDYKIHKNNIYGSIN
jgi:hypothetical protein